VSTIALWILVIFETGLLLLLLRSLGELRQNGLLSSQDPQKSNLVVGERAPTFVTTDQNGTSVDSNAFQGKRCILAFVSPGCSACTGTITAIKTVMQDHNDLVVLLIGGPNNHRNKDYLRSQNIQLPILKGASELTTDLYHIHAYPSIFILDEEGLIRAKGVVNRYEDLQDLLSTAFSTIEVAH
jgi:methylamine dehydrogenase accessory protein MauD